MKITRIKEELESIEHSPEFEHSDVLKRFLNFVVTETIEGNGEQLKALVIAQAVFGRTADDEGAESVVRSAAVRLRSALAAYRARREDRNAVVITLPKGRYVPEFIFPEPAQPVFDGAEKPLAKPSQSFSVRRAAILIGLVFLGLAILATSYYLRTSRPELDIRLVVLPTQAVGTDADMLAQQAEYALVRQLAEIGLVTVIVPPGGQDPTKGSHFDLSLHTQVDANLGVLGWRLVRADGGIIWSASESLSRNGIVDIEDSTSRLAFRTLGENGAIPLALQKNFGTSFAGTVCKTRGQLLLYVQNDDHFNDMRRCLTEHLDAQPNDGNAWAVLSETLAARSRYYSTYSGSGYSAMVQEAVEAANRAAALSPDAYLTKAAQMRVALSSGQPWLFNSLQQQLRVQYPGDFQRHLRIASGLASLGQGHEALLVYKNVLASGISLDDRQGELALAYLASGDIEAAARHIEQEQSDQLYALLIKATIFHKIGRLEEARQTAERLITRYPDISQDFYPWLSGLGWAPSLLQDIAQSLAALGVDLDTPDVVSTAENEP